MNIFISTTQTRGVHLSALIKCLMEFLLHLGELNDAEQEGRGAGGGEVHIPSFTVRNGLKVLSRRRRRRIITSFTITKSLEVADITS